MARTLWGFNIAKKTAPDGSVIETSTKFVEGFFSSPEKFECDITVRSPEHEKVIREAFNASQEEGLNYRSYRK